MGCHTSLVARGLRIGMGLFILSEAAFFLSFFWAFFHCRFGALMQMERWPPVGVKAFKVYGIPVLNTGLLLASGVTVTWTHKAIQCCHNSKEDLISLGLTIFLGLSFTKVQLDEYLTCSFRIWDGAFGRTFFVMTGFHGLHVIVGSLFLIVCFFRCMYDHFYVGENHVGLQAAIWYWHFVDVV